MKKEKKFIFVFLLTLSTFVVLTLLLELVLGVVFGRKISENIETVRKEEFTNAWQTFLNQRYTQNENLVYSQAWWSQVSELFRSKDYEQAVQIGFWGDTNLIDNYDLFLAINAEMETVFAIWDGISTENDTLDLDSIINHEQNFIFYRQAEKEYEKYSHLLPQRNNITDDLEELIVWHSIGNYNGEVMLLTVTPICSNEGYPIAKGFYLYGQTIKSIIEEAENIIPADIELTSEYPKDSYTCLSVDCTSCGMEYFITFEPNLHVSDIVDRSFLAFITGQAILLIIGFSVIYPIFTRKYTLHLEKTIDEKTQKLQTANIKLMESLHKLNRAEGKITHLTKLIPICSSCKKVRNDEGFWKQVEEFIGKQAGIELTHSLCPDCMEKLYPEYKGD